MGSQYDASELRQVASQEDRFIHVDSFPAIYEKISEIAQRICSVQAKVAFDTSFKVSCGQGELRYFMASTKSLRYEFVGVYQETSKGLVQLYHSFVYKNPTSDNHDTRTIDPVRRREAKAASFVWPSLFFTVEDNAESQLYLTVDCRGVENEVEILIKNEDF